MTYRQAFDHIGNPVYRRAKSPLGHRIVQAAGAVACVVLLAMLYGVRP